MSTMLPQQEEQTSGKKVVTFYATFDAGGPLAHSYAIITTETSWTARQWLKLHFPLDFATLYRESEFLPL